MLNKILEIRNLISKFEDQKQIINKLEKELQKLLVKRFMEFDIFKYKFCIENEFYLTIKNYENDYIDFDNPEMSVYVSGSGKNRYLKVYAYNGVEEFIKKYNIKIDYEATEEFKKSLKNNADRQINVIDGLLKL